MNFSIYYPAENKILANKKLEMLHEFALLLNSSYNIEQILRESVKKIRQVTDSYGCHIMFSQCLADRLELKTAIHDGEKPLPAGVDVTKGKVAQETFRTGKIVIIDDTMHDPRIIQEAREYIGHRSMAAVPVIVKGDTIGAIVVYSENPAHYVEIDAQFLLMLGNHLGLAVENSRLIQELKTAVVVDSLTGAFNHRYLLTKLSTLTDQNPEQSISLIMIDVDCFKYLNDTHGHLTGDYVLREITNLLINSVRDNDIVTRYGGDEFAVVLPAADIDDTKAIGARMEQAVADKTFFFDGEYLKVTISWGAVTLASKDVKGVNDIIKLADRKLLEMKKKKRNKHQVKLPAVPFSL